MDRSKLPTRGILALDRARELRKEQTPAEELLWSRLRNGALGGLKFRRQHPVGNFIVDFYCSAARVVVEVDGDTHAVAEDYDSRRTQWLEGQGCCVIRFTNEDVFRRLEWVLKAIYEACMERPHP